MVRDLLFINLKLDLRRTIGQAVIYTLHADGPTEASLPLLVFTVNLLLMTVFSIAFSHVFDRFQAISKSKNGRWTRYHLPQQLESMQY